MYVSLGPRGGKQIATLAMIARAGTAYFVAIIAALHFLQPDYNPIERPTSEYAVGTFGVFMTSAFVGLSIATWAMIIELKRGLVRSTESRIGLGLLQIWGAGLLSEESSHCTADREDISSRHCVCSRSVLTSLHRALTCHARVPSLFDQVHEQTCSGQAARGLLPVALPCSVQHRRGCDLTSRALGMQNGRLVRRFLNFASTCSIILARRTVGGALS
jgi:hypothetical protein